MFAWWIKKKLDSFEKAHNYDMNYMRDMLAVSPRAVLSYARAIQLSRYRGGLSLEAWHVVNIIGIVHEDCGACAQLAVDLALESGVAASPIRAVVSGDLGRLPEGSRLVAQFARAVLHNDAAADELRAQVCEQHGREALLAIAFALTTTKMYPTVKRVLGHAHSCVRLEIAGQSLSPGLAAPEPAGTSTAA